MTLHFAWNGRLTVDGNSVHDTADTLAEAILARIPPSESTPTLDLYGLDIDTGVATAAWHAAIRRIRDDRGRVILVDAPQMLAHSLYKVGDLTDGRIHLESPRTDEGTTAN